MSEHRESLRAMNRVHALAGQIADGLATALDARRLSDLLIDNPDARREYIAYLEIHGCLAWSLSFPQPPSVADLQPAEDLQPVADLQPAPEASGPDACGVSRDARDAQPHVSVERAATGKESSGWRSGGPLVRHLRRAGSLVMRPTPLSWIVAAAVVATVLVTAASWYFPGRNDRAVVEPPIVPPTPVLPAARIVALDDCIWAEGATICEAGDSLAAGDAIDLKDGLLELRFRHGATIIVRGPAALTVVSPSGVRLDDGLLTGSVQPGGRHGFTVWTAAARIDDIGTRFGVAAIRSGDSVVHVFDGLVQVDPAGDDETTTHLVEAGQSLRVRYSGGSVVGALEDRPKFVRALTPAADSSTIAVDFSTTPDNAYPGRGAGGWVTPWTSLVDGRGEFSDGPRIVAGSEQDDGSRSRAHLFATAHAGDEARTIATIARRYGQYRRFALWQPRTMRFSVRIDSPMPESAGRDRCVTIMESGTLRGTGGMGDTAWAIRGYAGEVQGVRAGNWTFFDAADGLKHVDSTMPIVAGRTYRFMLSAWPSRNTWDVEVSDGKRTVRASHLLGRGLASRCEQGAGIGYLHFCARLGPKDSPLSFAVEDVSVGPLVEKTGSID